jgi:hypothetical protein
MLYWFQDRADKTCELCRQHFTQPKARLCENCEEAIVRLLRLDDGHAAHYSPSAARAQVA